MVCGRNGTSLVLRKYIFGNQELILSVFKLLVYLMQMINPEEYLYQPQLEPHEIEFAQYEYEKWEDRPEAWSPLITLEQLAARPDLAVEWYCPSWIPVGAKTVLSAEPKCGK